MHLCSTFHTFQRCKPSTLFSLLGALIAIAWSLCSPSPLVVWQLGHCVLGVLVDRALACGFPLTIPTLLNIVMTVCPQRLKYLLAASRGCIPPRILRVAERCCENRTVTCHRSSKAESKGPSKACSRRASYWRSPSRPTIGLWSALC